MLARESVDFHDQFVLRRGLTEKPGHFRDLRSGDWQLSSHPSLPVTTVVLRGNPIGWLLGWAVAADGTVVHNEAELAVSGCSDDWSAFESELYGLAGRWVCVLLGDEPRVYLDSGGSLAVVYDAAAQTVASTTSMLRWSDPFTFSGERYERRALSPNQFFPGGRTSDPHARRLLPNHFLDLSGWTVARHWPLAEIERVATQSDVDRYLGRMFSAVENLIFALAGLQRLILPLTGGRDSRMILAAARHSLSQCEFVTFQYSRVPSTDSTFSKIARRRFGLFHSIVKTPKASPQDRARYLTMIGYDANEGKARDFLLAAGQLPNDRGWLTGFAGEVGRGYYWGHSNGKLDARDLLACLGLPETKENTREIDVWLQGLPRGDREQVLDLMYIEFRLGCWASPQLYGVTPFSFNIVPLNQKIVFDAMLRLPVTYRRKQRLASDFVALGWADLLDLPFGRPPGLSGIIQATTEVAVRAYSYLARRARRLTVLKNRP